MKEHTTGHRTKKEIEERKLKLVYQKNNPDLFVTSQYKYRTLNPLKYLYRLAKRRAKKRKIDFNIEWSDLKLPEICPLLEIKLDQTHKDLDYHYSIDRIDNSKGYIKGNVMVISHRANRLKNNSTSNELMLLAKNLSKFENIF